MTTGAERALGELAGVLGPQGFSVAEADRLAVSVDLWPRHLIRLAQGERADMPVAVVWPESVTELRDVVLVAQAHGLSLLPYGAGSGVVGGTTPEAKQVVVDLKRMSRLLLLDEEALTATAEVGIMGELLERQLARRGFTQGHFPSSIFCSTLGGWIAAKSAGQMSSRYGKIEDQLLGGVLVLGDGRIFRQSASPATDPVFRELVGAEGTLGIWAEATVRIHPLPARRVWRGLLFPTLPRAIACVEEWLAVGLCPSVVRIYDPLDTFLHRQTHAPQAPRDRGPSRLAWLGATFPKLTSALGDILAHGCQCIVGVQGDEHEVDDQMQLALAVAQELGATDLGAEPGEAWYARRYAVSYAQSRAFRAGVVADTMEVACAWSDIVRTYEAVRRAGLKAGAQVLAHFSHVYLEGGSIYFTFALPISKGTAGYDRLWSACLTAALDAGANVSHHHGTGRLKAAALRRALTGAEGLWKAQRQRLDPHGVLNPALFSGAATDAAPIRGTHHPGPGLATAAPGLSVAEVERGLLASGRSLGPAAALCGETRLVEAARRGWLWRFDPQLRVVERIVCGVDAQVQGRAHRYIPGPRSAMGPDLAAQLLEEQVERLWLRTEATVSGHLEGSGTLQDLVKAARCILADETAAMAPLRLTAGRDGAKLVVGLPSTRRRATIRERATRAVTASLRLVDGEGAGALPALPGDALFVGGAWQPLVGVLLEAVGAGLEVVLPWLDPVGAVGFLVGRPGFAPELRAHMARLIEERGVAGRGSIEPPPHLDVNPAVVAPALPSFHEVSLSLAGHEGALDNCTYCPKLCRFACPVAVAMGSETLTPRQLMLTANLVRTGRAALGAEVLAPLWACVDCRSCKSFCDHGNDVATVLMQARAELYAQDAAPAPVRDYLAALRDNGRPPDRPKADDVTTALREGASTSAVGLFCGCQGSAGDPGPAEAAFALVEAALGRPRVVGTEVRCCGMPLWRWGDRQGFAAHAARFGAQLKGVTTLVVDDPGCAYALKVLYPGVGVAVPEIVTTTKLLASRAPAPIKAGEHWAPHDDEFAARWLEEPSLRDQLRRVDVGMPAGSVLEGVGGSSGGMLLGAFDPVLARRVARACVDDLLGGGATRILTASPTCRRVFKSMGAEVDDLVLLLQGHRG